MHKFIVLELGYCGQWIGNNLEVLKRGVGEKMEKISWTDGMINEEM